MVYDLAFSNRVALLYLDIHRKPSWSDYLLKRYTELQDRFTKTYSVIADLSTLLNNFCPNNYAIFKSIKPYPATPNDTDVILFGDKEEFKKIITHLYCYGYFFHEWAPMQTTICDPRGIGKTGKGKIGGTYYIDLYSEISTDYFLYIDKKCLKPYVFERQINGIKVKTLRQEIELAIILFHNVFPERTFQLEHFYMPLYLLVNQNFNLHTFIQFTESQKLVHAIATNLTIIEYIHQDIFGFKPDPIVNLLKRWGRNDFELNQFKQQGCEMPYLFSPKTFWKTFFHKSHDQSALKSLFVQGIHMLNPLFFADVVKSLRNRFNDKGTYHLE